MNFKDLLQQISDVKEWLENEVGIKDFSETRIPKIIECLEFLDKEYEKFAKGEESNLAGLGKDSDAAVIETISLNTIKQGLSLFDKSHMPKEALKQCLKGSFSSLDEDDADNSNYARNILYELELGAYLLLNKISVYKFEDINFKYGIYNVAIQCKRPLGIKGLERNIDKAVKQLKDKNNVDKEKNSVGLVAVSLEKIYALDKLKLFESREELKAVIANIYHQAEKEILPIWEKKRSTKIIGITLTLKTTGAFKDTKEIQTINNSIFRCRFGEQNSPRKTVCKYLTSKLNKQSITYSDAGEPVNMK